MLVMLILAVMEAGGRRAYGGRRPWQTRDRWKTEGREDPRDHLGAMEPAGVNIGVTYLSQVAASDNEHVLPLLLLTTPTALCCPILADGLSVLARRRPPPPSTT